MPYKTSSSLICHYQKSKRLNLDNMTINNNFIIPNLFKYGLGEYLVLHIKEDKSILGKIVFEKGKMLLKDDGLSIF